MAALNFKKQFAGPVERREKRQSIRANAARFKIGAPIQLYTGMRTKACRKLAAEDPECVSIAPIIIGPEEVSMGMHTFRPDHLERFVRADGFESVDAFFAFFASADGRDFEGFLIKWDWL